MDGFEKKTLTTSQTPITVKPIITAPRYNGLTFQIPMVPRSRRRNPIVRDHIINNNVVRLLGFVGVDCIVFHDEILVGTISFSRGKS